MSNHIDQIKSRITISSIISRQVRLKKKSNGEYIGLCPFHNEKSPSFNVSDNKGFYHCFGCGIHGDIFSYVMEYDRLSFSEALKELAAQAQVELPKFSSNQTETYNEQEIVLSINEMACQYFTDKLFSDSGKIGLSYFKKRGLTDEMINEYRLGYNDQNVDDLLNILKTKFSIEDILKAKIISEGNYGLYNHFRNRVIFPIMDRKNQVIAFGGRILDESQPKYLNSAETAVFNKSYTLYGLNHAVKAMKQFSTIIVVEGYMDVLSLAASGISNAVAPLGTSITLAQIKLLWQKVDVPQICLDDDLAGQKASIRIAKEVLPHLSINKSLEFIALNHGKDPDEVIKIKGVDYFNSLTKAAIPLSEYLFQYEMNSHSLNTPENIAAFKNRLFEIANLITDRNIKFAYNIFFKNKFFETIQFVKKNLGNKSRLKLSTSSLLLNNNSNFKTLVNILNKFPSLIVDDEISEIFDEKSLETNFLDKVRDYILNFKNQQSLDFFCVFKEIMKDHFGIELDKQKSDIVDRITDVKDAKKQIIRISKLNTLNSLKSQIQDVTNLLHDRQDEVTFKKLSYLKSYEEKLRTELNLIN